ncbi:Smr-domain-containing protein [Vararia minispora EC-137]|uniref:Smr-domain-containing protein n=1 Tax=Vararia minispora EC-137 TaxID=1314806 RepID=A0ACB8QWH3_9AGAM|nr:Smr-domain-containing protein [Vararia minispora EC-137]
MGRAFEEARRAYAAGDGKRAKELSNKGREHERERNQLNNQASELIFRENNQNKGPGEVDLHGLRVDEAVKHTEREIQAARSRGDTEIRLIVGKGLHSSSGVPVVKPAVQRLMKQYNLACALDPDNTGVLIVQLEGGHSVKEARGRGAPVLDPDNISHELEKREGSCIIM